MSQTTPKQSFKQANPALWAILTAPKEDLEKIPERFNELREFAESNRPEIPWPEEPNLDGPYL